MLKSNSFVRAVVMLTAIFLMQACGAIQPYYSEEVEDWESGEVPPAEELVSSVFLIGDVGAPETDGQEPSLKLLQLQLHGIGGTDAYATRTELPDSMKSVIFLGDNIYYDGLSEIDDPERPDEERRLMEQMKIVKNWDGKAVFIPGNHDWNFSSEGGLAAVIRQEQFVEEFLEDEEAFLPDLGCPGPYPLEVSEDLVLILIDSEWWLTENRRPEGLENGCGIASELDLIVALDDMLDRYENKHVVLALHHPLMTNGNHGGHYSIMDHIFPLTLVYSDLYIPLPVIGSIYPLARMYGVSRQDLANPKYAQLRDALFSVLEGRNNVVVAAGHEHSLQYFEYEGIQQIVSGAGCKDAFCVGGGQAIFAHQHEGFARLNYYKNGETWVEFWEPVDDGSTGRLVFRKPLYALSTPEDQLITDKEIPDYTDSVKVIAANADFNELGIFGRRIWGDHYREEWEQPLEVPYLDFERTKGGLSVVKKGGGQQTLSLHLMDRDSLTYYFRSVDKFPAGVLPEGFRTTFAADLVKDQISSSHPYGALALAKMAEAADVYYAEPELYYMPYTPSLGPYLNEFGGMLGLLELKADEDVSDYENFGNAENAVSTRTMFEHLYEDNDNEVNQETYLRTRLFDMLIGDWDRHEGQWRWAEFEKDGKGSVFEPIPKDRDQVFVKYDGLLPWLFSRKWALRKFQNFDYDFEDVVGLNINGTHLDRRLMTELEWEEWEEEVHFLQEELTDSVIEASIKDLPPEIFKISGDEIVAKLKSRRDQLLKAAREYYEALSRYVDVVGTDKHELFEVKRLPNGFTEVVVHKTEKDGKVEDLLYERTFDPELTKEIRIYGLDGIDKFFISGTAEDAIELRIIGGEEDDILRDSSSVSDWGNTIIYYDNEEEENEITAGKETRLRLTSKEYLNEYDPEEFAYPYVGPRISVEYNRDDGLFLGGGFNIKTYGFKKKPVATDQTFLANYAIATGAFTFKYRGIFHSLFSDDMDLLLDADVYGPKYVLNYFGQGNSSLYEEDIAFYRINQNRVEVSPFISWELHEVFRLGAGPSFQYVDLGSDENRETIIDSDILRQSSLFADNTYMAGGRFFAELEALNDDIAPTRGIHWMNELTYYNSLNHEKVNFSRLATDLVLYISPDIRFTPTLALRFGGQRNFGDYLFYQSATLGNNENLRGYRRSRFAGNASLFQNTELRVPVGAVNNYVFTGKWGVYGFIDHGRVWSDVPESGEWHRSYGPGLFLNLFDLFVASGSVGFSEEGHYFTLNAGYFFE